MTHPHTFTLPRESSARWDSRARRRRCSTQFITYILSYLLRRRWNADAFFLMRAWTRRLVSEEGGGNGLYTAAAAFYICVRRIYGPARVGKNGVITEFVQFVNSCGILEN